MREYRVGATADHTVPFAIMMPMLPDICEFRDKECKVTSNDAKLELLRTLAMEL
jgi:hypothetical protein